jgi:hypothetical protein
MASVGLQKERAREEHNGREPERGAWCPLQRALAGARGAGLQKQR